MLSVKNAKIKVIIMNNIYNIIYSLYLRKKNSVVCSVYNIINMYTLYICIVMKYTTPRGFGK